METLDLSDFFKTKAESINFSTRLLEISEKIYTTDFNLEKALIEKFGVQLRDKFVTLLINNKINENSKSDLNTFFSKVIEQIAALPTLSVSIPFEPDEKTLEVLSQWFLLNIKKQFLFDFKVDKSLIAGTEIMTNGKHLNLSIKAKLDQIVNSEILSILHPEPVKTAAPSVNNLPNNNPVLQKATNS